jgi:hypothetical protein
MGNPHRRSAFFGQGRVIDSQKGIVPAQHRVDLVAEHLLQRRRIPAGGRHEVVHLLDVFRRHARADRLHALAIPRQQQTHEVERRPPPSSLVPPARPRTEQATRRCFHPSLLNLFRAGWKEKCGEVVLNQVRVIIRRCPHTSVRAPGRRRHWPIPGGDATPPPGSLWGWFSSRLLSAGVRESLKPRHRRR